MIITYKHYRSDMDTVEIADGFFDGWPNPPSKAVHRKILEQSYLSIVAIENNRIVGFVNVVSDGVLSAYIPLLEVIEDYQGKGIGKKLVENAIAATKDLYMIDVACDDDVVPFYEKFDMIRGNSMILRNYDKQSGE